MNGEDQGGCCRSNTFEWLSQSLNCICDLIWVACVVCECVFQSFSSLFFRVGGDMLWYGGSVDAMATAYVSIRLKSKLHCVVNCCYQNAMSCSVRESTAPSLLVNALTVNNNLQLPVNELLKIIEVHITACILWEVHRCRFIPVPIQVFQAERTFFSYKWTHC